MWSIISIFVTQIEAFTLGKAEESLSATGNASLKGSSDAKGSWVKGSPGRNSNE